MADEVKKVPSWVWIVAALVILFLIFRSVDMATKKATSPGTAKNLGYGIGSGAADSLGSAAGKFFSNLFGSSSSKKSSDDAGGPVDISGSVDWDRNPPSDAIADDLEGPSFE